MPKMIDIAGLKFGRLTVIRHVGFHERMATWLCVCDCGNEHVAPGVRIRSGNTKSCGCLRADHMRDLPKHATHGATRNKRKTTEYTIWASMKNRCERPAHPSYRRYGGRGITVCAEWQNDFAAFLAHVGPRPSTRHSLDRINNARGYEPGNVRWATIVEQMQNTSANRFITVAGQTMTIAEARRRYCPNTPKGTISARISRGMKPEDAILMSANAV